MEERLTETEDGDFEYKVLYPDTRFPPSFINVSIPVRKHNGTEVAHCEHMEYYNAKRVGEELEEKGYEVAYPDPPFEIRLYEKIRGLF